MAQVTKFSDVLLTNLLRGGVRNGNGSLAVARTDIGGMIVDADPRFTLNPLFTHGMIVDGRR
jgi:hypothetical protein